MGFISLMRSRWMVQGKQEGSGFLRTVEVSKSNTCVSGNLFPAPFVDVMDFFKVRSVVDLLQRLE